MLPDINSIEELKEFKKNVSPKEKVLSNNVRKFHDLGGKSKKKMFQKLISSVLTIEDKNEWISKISDSTINNIELNRITESIKNSNLKRKEQQYLLEIIQKMQTPSEKDILKGVKVLKTIFKEFEGSLNLIDKLKNNRLNNEEINEIKTQLYDFSLRFQRTTTDENLTESVINRNHKTLITLLNQFYTLTKEDKEVVSTALKDLPEFDSKYKSDLMSKIDKMSDKSMQEVAKESYSIYPYLQHKDQPEKQRVVWSLYSIHPFDNSLSKIESNLDVIREKHPNLVLEAEIFLGLIKNTLEDVIEIKQFILDEETRLKGTTAQQFLLKAAKNNETSEKNKKAFKDYADTLENWEPAEVKDGILKINGKKVGEKAIAGVMIGRGTKVHPMEVQAGTTKDKKTGEIKEVIFVGNRTQWWNSDLVILDTMENVPEDVISDRGVSYTILNEIDKIKNENEEKKEITTFSPGI